MGPGIVAIDLEMSRAAGLSDEDTESWRVTSFASCQIEKSGPPGYLGNQWPLEFEVVMQSALLIDRTVPKVCERAEH